MQTLTDINLVNFNNVERYNKNDNNETLQAFVDLVNANARFSSLPEVVSNLNANNNRINISVKTMTSVKQIISDIRDLCTKASDESLTSLQRDGYHAQLMDRLIQTQRIQQESKYNGLSNFSKFPANNLPSSLKPSGSSSATTYTGLFETYATTGNNLTMSTITTVNGVTTYNDIPEPWKAQVGFDTGSTLDYNISRWGPAFMKSHHTPLTANSATNKFDFGTDAKKWDATNNASTGATAHECAERAELCIDEMQKQELRLQKDIADLQSVYAYLERQQAQVKTDHEAAIKSIESQRASAKRQLENDLKNQIRQIEYLNLVVGYRPN
jgi:flagellin-like hook-associated protein FlgL